MSWKGLYKNLIYPVIRAVILVITGVMAGWMLLMAVYLLPVGRMQDNLSGSVGILEAEREYHRVIPGYVGTQLDNYTDAWMMGNAAYDSPLPVWKRALACASADYGEGPLDGLVRYLDTGEEGTYREIEYTRYWHGYLVVLKPFFLFFDYADLRAVNVALELLLVIAVFSAFWDKGYRGEAWGYIIAVLFMVPVVIPLSIQFSVVFYLVNAAVLILLKKYDRIADGNRLPVYFQLIGMAVSYFDFLTYPVASLGVPLTCVLLLGADSSFRARARKIVCLSISWGFGYGAMWAGKWILSTLVLGDDVIADALSQILMRASHVADGEKITMADTWLRNVEFYFKKPYLALVVICVAAAMAGFYKNRRRLLSAARDCLPFALVALMPFAWYAFAGQHSYEHHWFTFRGLMASVFACMCICARLCGGRGRG